MAVAISRCRAFDMRSATELTLMASTGTPCQGVHDMNTLAGAQRTLAPDTCTASAQFFTSWRSLACALSSDPPVLIIPCAS